MIKNKFLIGNTDSGIEIEIEKSKNDIYFISRHVWEKQEIEKSSSGTLILIGSEFDEFKKLVNLF